MKKIRLLKEHRIGRDTYPKGYVLNIKDESNVEKWGLIIAEDPYSPNLTIYLKVGEYEEVNIELSSVYNHAIIVGYDGPVENFIKGRNYHLELKYARHGEFDPLNSTLENLAEWYIKESDNSCPGAVERAEVYFKRHEFMEELSNAIKDL